MIVVRRYIGVGSNVGGLRRLSGEAGRGSSDGDQGKNGEGDEKSDGIGSRLVEDQGQGEEKKLPKLHERLRKTQAMQKDREKTQKLRSLPSDLLREAQMKNKSGTSELAEWSEALFGSKQKREGEGQDDKFVDPFMYLSNTEKEKEEEEDELPDHPMFAEQYTKDIPTEELEPMETVYNLLLKHKTFLESNTNVYRTHHSPLFDEIDFPVNRLPRIPREVLEAYKKEYPEERANEPPFVGSKLSALERDDSMPEDFRTWNEVDRRTGDTEQMLRVNRRTPEDRPDRMMTNPLLNPDPLPKPESVCRLTELNNGGTPRVDFRQVGVLNEFVSSMGLIMHKKDTKLSLAAQKNAARAIKAARHMRLLSHWRKVPIPPESDWAANMLIKEVMDELKTERRQKLLAKEKDTTMIKRFGKTVKQRK